MDLLKSMGVLLHVSILSLQIQLQCAKLDKCYDDKYLHLKVVNAFMTKFLQLILISIEEI